MMVVFGTVFAKSRMNKRNIQKAKDMKKGNIGVTTENIFPVIKKFLYSDHEIFLREMVSNAVDATQSSRRLLNKATLRATWATSPCM